MKNNEITFSNSIFDQILGRSENSVLEGLSLDKKVFKVYRKDNDQDDTS